VSVGGGLAIGMLEVQPKGLVRTPEWSAARRVAGVPGARQVVLQGVDHFVPMRAPEPFAREVLAFLDKAAP
jgi:pimeloyl-ACP methyl ester carboxylesterase